jgi:hypothetical protein
MPQNKNEAAYTGAASISLRTGAGRGENVLKHIRRFYKSKGTSVLAHHAVSTIAFFVS